MRCVYLMAAALAACGGGGESDGVDARVYGEQCRPGGTFGELDGRAAVLGTLNVHVNASGLVEVDTTAELLLVLDVDQTGSTIAVAAGACAIEIPDVPIAGQDRPIEFEVPQATVESVGTVTGAGTLSSPDEVCADITTDQFTLVLGARLSGTTSPLPQADDQGAFAECPPAGASCPLAIGSNCACDQESDNKPGTTLLAYNVPAVNLDEVYVALRTRFGLTGEVFSTDLLIGEIEASIELGILGCNIAGGGACTPDQIGVVKNLNPVITQQPGNPSLFRAVRVDPTTTCADIVARRDELFPR